MPNTIYTSSLIDLAKSINIYFSASIIPIGIFLNILTIFIFSKRKFNNLTVMKYYYICLAIFDILALSNSILFIQLLPNLNIRLLNKSEFMCKFFMLWRRVVIQSPSWILVIITLDRFKSVYFPNRFKLLEKGLQLF